MVHVVSSISCAEIGVPIDLRQGLWESLELRKEVKPLILYDGERGIALRPMLWNWSSFPVDMRYAELFHLPTVTSVSF